MIKFFRKIRQRLLSENKVSKYLLYAIGEIVLVVIGILIALQINNWNENRKNNASLINYKKNLIEDLKKDSLDIDRVILEIKKDSTTINNFQKRVSNSTKALDTILKIARYEYVYYIWIHNDYNNDTYQVLNSTGDIGLFNSEIIDDLNALNNFQETALYSDSHTTQSYLANLRSYSQKYPVPFQSNLIANGSHAADIIWEQISLRNHATEFNSLIIAKADSYRLALRYLPLVLEETNALLVKLRKL